ncbi:MAG: hypothetical protein HQL40_21145, partial [Alphaproteobacteria bacterium]|nr:hypothetical protein [Alphaproteobacteria bacterium]
RWDAAKAAFTSINAGIGAHLLLVAEVFRYLDGKGIVDVDVATEAELLAAVEPVLMPYLNFIRSASDDDMEKKFSKHYGSGGVVGYFYMMCEIIHAKDGGFGPEDFRKWMTRRGDERISQADKDIINLTRVITDAVFDKLKEVYGIHQTKSGECAYWELGIESTKAKEEAYKRQLSEPVETRLPKEAYVDIIDLMKIIRQKNNWDSFKSLFNLQMPLEQSGKVYYLDWMEQFNKLRRIPAHSSSLRHYEEADYEFLSWIKGELSQRLPGKNITLVPKF